MIENYIKIIKQEIDIMLSINRKVRKPEEIVVQSLFRKILFITFITGFIGVSIVLLSSMIDALLRVIL